MQVLVTNSCANDVTASKQTAASTEAINNKKFMPSYKVLFRRSGRKKIISFIFTNFSLLKYLYTSTYDFFSDGELLLPSLPASVAPFLEALQTSESNNLNSYEEVKPTYGPQVK